MSALSRQRGRSYRGRSCLPRNFWALVGWLASNCQLDGLIFSDDLEPLVGKEQHEWAEPQLSVRSARARELARRLASHENRSISNVVERALEAYEARGAGRESAPAFYARLRQQASADVDLEAVIRSERRSHERPVL